MTSQISYTNDLTDPLTSDDLRLIAFRQWEESGPATFTFGINTGLCIFVVPCLEFGTSGEGPYIKWGVGGVIDGPGLVTDNENPECGGEETVAYGEIGLGPLAANVGASRSGRTSSWDSLGPGGGIELPDGGALPSLRGLTPGGGVVHRWTAC